ncbi:MAG: hypothetical protein JST01_27505 [Cyanobacteria bacterium SZAS TMP-1]|nr:hypothetical protein [Cyanobacteria bacterium SZAS TMP-1]
MDPNSIPMLLTIVGGFALSILSTMWEGTTFAREHPKINFFGGLAVIVAAAFGAVLFTHNGMGWMLLLMGFVGFTKLKEARQERKNYRALCSQLQSQVASALAGRHGVEAVEIDVSNAPESARWMLINENVKRGLTVETIKSHSTKSVKLRLSGPVSSAS